MMSQDGDARVEAGERDGENTGLLAADNSGLLDGNEDILEDAEKTTDPYTILGNPLSLQCLTQVIVKFRIIIE